MQVPSGNALYEISGGAAAHRPSEQVQASNTNQRQAQALLDPASGGAGDSAPRVDLGKAAIILENGYPAPRGSVLDIIV